MPGLGPQESMPFIGCNLPESEAGYPKLPNDIFEDLDAVSVSRQALYSFLSRVFERELTVDIIGELQGSSDAIGKLAPLRGLGNRKLNEGLDLLESFLKTSRSEPNEEVQKRLAAEFAGLFRGGSQKATRPSESSYLAGRRSAKPLDQITTMYKSVGLDKAPTFDEPDDHIAIELQFMSYLAGETAAAAKSRDQARAAELLRLQNRFLRNHLYRWVGLLAADLNTNAKSQLYGGAGLVAAGFVEEDVKTVDDFIEDIAPSSKAS